MINPIISGIYFVFPAELQLKLLADLASWRFFYDLSGKIELIPAPLIAFGVKLIDEAHLFL